MVVVVGGRWRLVTVVGGGGVVGVGRVVGRRGGLVVGVRWSAFVVASSR
ncbi:hypothetical protein ACXZ9C_11145 [Streptococcus agalactiae]